MESFAFWLVLYTSVISTLSFIFGRLSTVGHPLRRPSGAPRSPQEARKVPPPTQDPTLDGIGAPGASQALPSEAIQGLQDLAKAVGVSTRQPKFSWNPDCPMCGRPDKVVMADEGPKTQRWCCYSCNHFWRT